MNIRPQISQVILYDPIQDSLGSSLRNSRPLDVHRWSEFPEVKSAVAHIFQEMKLYDEGNPGHPKKMVPRKADDKMKLKKHIQVVVLDLYHCHLYTPGMFVAYSRDNNKFAGPERYNKLSIKSRPLHRAIDGLIEFDYIENHRGFHIRKDPRKGKQSRMKATPKLIDLIEGRFGVTRHMISEHPEKEVIILRDASRKLMDYESSPAIDEMRTNLCTINQLLDQTDIQLAVDRGLLSENLDLSRKRLHRVFNNGSFDQGGRCFGPWWQDIPRELRRNIFINGKPTIELEYVDLHIRLLYAKEGTDYREDPYGYAGPALRHYLKLILVCSLNANSVRGAVMAIHQKAAKNSLLCPKTTLAGRKIKDIAQEFLAQHVAITHHFYSGIGTALQNLDSKISERVMVILASKGIPALPLHDGFICAQHDSDSLMDAMTRAFKLFSSGLEPEIKPMMSDREGTRQDCRVAQG